MGSIVWTDENEYSKTGDASYVWVGKADICPGDRLPYGAHITSAIASFEVKKQTAAYNTHWGIADDNQAGSQITLAGDNIDTTSYDSNNPKSASIAYAIKPNRDYINGEHWFQPTNTYIRFHVTSGTRKTYMRNLKIQVDFDNVTCTPVVSAGGDGSGTVTYGPTFANPTGGGSAVFDGAIGHGTYNFYAKATADTGSTFVEWQRQNGGTVSGYMCPLPMRAYDTPEANAGRCHVTAYFRLNQSTLSIDSNGGNWNGSSAVQTFTQGYNTTKSIPVPTRSGYKFTGWTRTNTYGTISSTTTAATYTFGATDNVTDYFVANWTALTSTLSVNPNGGNWNGSSSIQTFTQNAGTTKSIPIPTRSDYTFGGWIRANKYGTVTTTSSATTYTFGLSENVTDYLIATWDKFISLSNPSLTYLNEQVSVNNKVLALEQPILYVEVTDGKSLPSQYEQIAYLQSTGDQFIDTGITSQTNIIAQLDFEWWISNGARAMLSSYADTSCPYYLCFNRNASIEYKAGNSSAASISQKWIPFTRYNLKIETTPTIQKMWIDDVLVTTYEKSVTKQPENTLYLFASHDLEEPNTYNVWAAAKARLYSCKITDIYGTKIRDYIPCRRKSDNVLGLYDFVTEQFYTTPMSTPFIVDETAYTLPSTYQEVEYIQSDGNQVIDTGVPSKAGQSVILDFEYTTISGNQAMFSSYKASGEKRYYVCFARSDGKMQYGAGTSGLPTISQKFVANTRYKYIAEMTSSIQKLWINGDFIVNYSSNATTDTNDVTFYLFASHDMAEPSTQYIYARSKAKLYSCKVINTDTNEYIRNFVPCYRKSDNEIGLYDLINNTFYTNIGSGSFTKGSNV